MLVSQNSTLNILVAQDNKAIKDVLKAEDAKTLEKMIKKEGAEIKDALKNLFESVKNGTKSNANIENILKNSQMFKELGSFSKSLETLDKLLEDEPVLEKYKPQLKAFLKDIKNLDTKTLKEQIAKSGVFLESKISEQNINKNQNLPNNIIKILNQIQDTLKDIKLPQKKQIEEHINKLVKTPLKSEENVKALIKDMKSLLSLVKNINSSLTSPNMKVLDGLMNQLKTIMKEASLIESKISNILEKPLEKNIAQTKVQDTNKQNIPTNTNNPKEKIATQVKELLSQIKKEVGINPTLKLSSQNLVSKLDNMIKSNDIGNKANISEILEMPALKILSNKSSNISNLVLNLKQEVNKLSQDISQNKPLNTQVKDLLVEIKKEVTISPNLKASSQNMISKLEIMEKANIKEVLNSPILKVLASKNPAISNIVSNLKDTIGQIPKQDVNSLNIQNLVKSTSIETKVELPKVQINTQVKELLSQIKKEVSINPTLKFSSQELVSKLDNMVKTNELGNNKELSSSNLKANISEVLNSPALKILATKNPNISNLVLKLENLISNTRKQEGAIQNQTLVKDTKIENNIVKLDIPQNLKQDKEQINTQTKEILTQVKKEVLENKDIFKNNSSILKTIDKTLASDDLFTKIENSTEPKKLIKELVNSKSLQDISSKNEKIKNILTNLKNITKDISNIEQKIDKYENVSEKKGQVLQRLKENISQLKTELTNIKATNPNVKESTLLNLTKLQNIQDIFQKVESANIHENKIDDKLHQFKNNFVNNLKNLSLQIKENIINTSLTQENFASKGQVLNLVEKLDTIIKDNLSQNLPNVQQNLNNTMKNESNSISNDMKNVLLKMQEELVSKTDVKSQEIAKQVDKMLMQIDYQQLVSYTSNSNFVYVPFVWDILEDGSINIKEGNDEKFYCQIDLTLKDLGKIDLMMALYDKNKIDLTIKTDDKKTKELFKENIKKLKQNLNNVSLIPLNINFIEQKENESDKKEKSSFMSNTYNNHLLNGVDIRV